MSKKEKKVDDNEAKDAGADVAPAGEDGAEGEAAPKKGKKKLVIIGGVVALLLIVGVVVMLMGGKKKAPVEGEEAAAHGEEKAGGEHGETKAEGEHGEAAGAHGGAAAVVTPVYYELPGFLVNLNSTSSRVSFLKMSVTLELRDAAAVAVMDANKPRVQDTFNTYLRELRPADIQGSAGIYRLRTELISRLNSTIAEGVVKDILFGEIIVQ